MKEPLSRYRSLYRLNGKLALVAGGAGAIGTAISQALAAYGAEVVVTARQEEKAEGVAEGIRRAGGRARGAAYHVKDAGCPERFVEGLCAEAGVPDILVNCVGTHIDSKAEEYRDEDWERVLGTNLTAAFYLSRALARRQIGAKAGKHIHISSVRGQLAIDRGYISYCVTRGGMNMMIRQLATEWAKYGITVNGIAPTFTRTPLVAQYLDDPAFYEPLVERIPLHRICDPSDIAAMAIYLACPASDFVTGQILLIDGGLTACQ